MNYVSPNVSINNSVFVVPVSLEIDVTFGKLFALLPFIWFQNSSKNVDDLIRIFRYQVALTYKDSQKFVADQVKSHTAIKLAEGLSDEMNEILYKQVFNKHNDSLYRNFTFIDFDNKRTEFSLKYVNKVPLKFTSDFIVSSSNTYNSTFRVQIIQHVVDRFIFRGYQPTLQTSTIEEVMSTRAYILCYIATMNKSYQKYLEIGTADDDNFSSMSNEIFSYAVGVDPAKGGTIRMTSDMYFETYCNESFDVIFIDGLHEAHQVYRDVLNALRVLRPNGMILIHDCNPTNELSENVYRPSLETTLIWNGDVWKALVALRLRNDLDIITIDTDHGIGVIRKGFPTAKLSEYWHTFLSPYPIHQLNYTYLDYNRTELLNLKTISEFKKWFHLNDNIIVEQIIY